MPLPALASVAIIRERLRDIFPEGTSNRAYVVREMAARTVFTMHYVGAVEGANCWLAPKHVYRMTNEQSQLDDNAARVAYTADCLKPGYMPHGERWYADNSREPIRDETLKDGLVQLGAVITREGVPTTSRKGRYALTSDFAALFDPNIKGERLEAEMENWRANNLSAGALARVQIVRRGAVATETGVMVAFPSGETRRMVAGPSSVISKAVAEEFAPRFLEIPGVIFLSESGNKVVARDDELAKAIGLEIVIDRHLPDMILVDLGPSDPLVVFVEVVATDGAVSEARKEALLDRAIAAGYAVQRVAFVTAYMDRDSAVFKKTLPILAWGTFAWFVSEPDHILHLRDPVISGRKRLHELLA